MQLLLCVCGVYVGVGVCMCVGGVAGFEGGVFGCVGVCVCVCVCVNASIEQIW